MKLKIDDFIGVTYTLSIDINIFSYKKFHYNKLVIFTR